MSPVLYTGADWAALLPFVALSGGAMFLFCWAFLVRRTENRTLVGVFSAAILLAAMGFICLAKPPTPFFAGLLVLDGISFGFSHVVLGLLLLTIPILPTGTPTLRENAHTTQGLLLLSACGALLMIFSNHLVIFFIGLELLSLPLYVLTGLGKNRAEASEAAFKYFLLGAFASAIFVYGVALVWGALGTVQISEMARAFESPAFNSPELFWMGCALLCVGLAFKLGLVPFHMWVPDVYEGAPASVVAWMAGGVKVATFAVVLRLVGGAISSITVDWATPLTWIAMASMVWGSLAALYQTQVKRMLAYSSVAHGGYATIGIICAAGGAQREASQALAYYLLVYGLGSLAAFLVLSRQEETTDPVSIDQLSGLAKRRPGLALGFTVALLSLAGLPPLAGFVGKFNLFVLAAQQGRYELLLVGVATSVVSLAYYLSLIVAVYMKDPKVDGTLSWRWGLRISLCVAAALLVLLGLFPQQGMEFLGQ